MYAQFESERYSLEDQQSPEWNSGTNLEGKEPFTEMSELLTQSESIYTKWGRGPVKPRLITIQRYLGDPPYTTGIWADKFTEAQQKELSTRYKKLTNAVGMLQADGSIRHDQYQEFPFDPKNPFK